MSEWARRENEDTAVWLRRLIAEGAPVNKIRTVTLILKIENQGKD